MALPFLHAFLPIILIFEVYLSVKTCGRSNLFAQRIGGRIGLLFISISLFSFPFFLADFGV